MHILSHKCLKSVDFIILLESITILLCKPFWHVGGRSLSLQISNPVVDLDDENEDIFEPRSFSGVFNTFVNQWCVKNIKMPSNLHLGSMLLPGIPEMLETHAYEKFSTLPRN